MDQLSGGPASCSVSSAKSCGEEQRAGIGRARCCGVCAERRSPTSRVWIPGVSDDAKCQMTAGARGLRLASCDRTRRPWKRWLPNERPDGLHRLTLLLASTGVGARAARGGRVLSFLRFYFMYVKREREENAEFGEAASKKGRGSNTLGGALECTKKRGSQIGALPVAHCACPK